MRAAAFLLLCIVVVSCRQRERDVLPPDSFAFAVVGDEPYRIWEYGRFKATLRDVSRSDAEWLIHVGDILWGSCSDRAYRTRLAWLNSVAQPVIYTPGDNEWTDCYRRRAGGYQPRERLQRLRTLFFATPGRTLGAHPMTVETQASDPEFSEFVENVRWRFGGFVFATIHIVGADNARIIFEDRTADDDSEVERRTRAALAWLAELFREAAATNARGVVVVMHADPHFHLPPAEQSGYRELLSHLAQHTRSYKGEVLLIHGDSHVYRFDHPLTDSVSGERFANFTRLETFGSPHIGWVRVVIDSISADIVTGRARVMSKWRLW